MASEAAMAEAFSVFDPTGSGTLGWAAFKDAVYTLGMPFSNESFLSVKGNVAEKDFKCDLAKFKMLFLQLSASLPASNANDDIKAAFAAMDSDRTGKISKARVHYYMTNVGDTFTADEMDKLLANAPSELDLAAFSKVVLGK